MVILGNPGHPTSIPALTFKFWTPRKEQSWTPNFKPQSLGESWTPNLASSQLNELWTPNFKFSLNPDSTTSANRYVCLSMGVRFLLRQSMGVLSLLAVLAVLDGCPVIAALYQKRAPQSPNSLPLARRLTKCAIVYWWCFAIAKLSRYTLIDRKGENRLHAV